MITLGIIEVDDRGAIVRIVNVNNANVQGGRGGLRAILERAGWAFA